MGLDITAFKQIRRIDCTFNKDGEPLGADGQPLDEDHFVRFTVIDEYFPGRAADIEDHHPYSFADKFGGPRSGYGGHSVFREALAKLAGYEPITPEVAAEVAGSFQLHAKVFPRQHNLGAEDHKRYHEGPFFELIYFTDCDGTLGTEICRKLAADFATFQAQADAQFEEDYREHYAKWRKALEFASDGGAVKFH